MTQNNEHSSALVAYGFYWRVDDFWDVGQGVNADGIAEQLEEMGVALEAVGNIVHGYSGMQYSNYLGLIIIESAVEAEDQEPPLALDDFTVLEDWDFRLERAAALLELPSEINQKPQWYLAAKVAE